MILAPIQHILWTSLHTKGPGRLVQYNPTCDLRALMHRQLLQIPYIKDLSKRLRREPYHKQACGYGRRAPCPAHFTQMKKRIGTEGFRIIEAWMRYEALRRRATQPLSAKDLVQATYVDGTDLSAWSRWDSHDTRRGLGDPDARVSRGKKGFLLGYQSLFLVDVEGMPQAVPQGRRPVYGFGVPEHDLSGYGVHTVKEGSVSGLNAVVAEEAINGSMPFF